MAGIVGHVTVIEFQNSLKADQVLVNKLNSLSNVEVILNAQVKEIFGYDKAKGVHYMNRSTSEDHTVSAEGIFVQIGLVPNTEWLKNTIDLNEYGEIKVNDKGETSLPGVFAAGDVTTTPYKQIIIAMGDGSKAALGAFDHLIRH